MGENRNRKQKLAKDIRGASMGNQKLVSCAISELMNGSKFMWERRVERGSLCWGERGGREGERDRGKPLVPKERNKESQVKVALIVSIEIPKYIKLR